NEKFRRDVQASDAVRRADQERILDGLRKKEETARRTLAKLLERSTLSSDLPELRSLVISSFAGWSAAKDLEYVNGELQRMLKNVGDGRLDFSKLEDGIHEFCRKLRWFPMTIDSLDGLVVVRDDAAATCPVPALETLAGTGAARHRYANPALRHPATRSCAI